MFDRCHYSVTDSTKEWSDEIAVLYRILVEVLKVKSLRQKANSMGLIINHKVRSLGLLKQCLVESGLGVDEAKEIIYSFHDLRDHKNILSAHSAKDETVKLRLEAISEHSSLRKHYRDLVKRCDASMQALIDNLQPSGGHKTISH